MINKFMRAAGAALAAALLVTAVAAQEAAISGEVRKIDENAGKITLKHGICEGCFADLRRIHNPIVIFA